VDAARTEAADAELVRMIERRSRKGEVDPDEREELWKESVGAYTARRREEMRSAWASYHAGQAARHRATLQALVGHPVLTPPSRKGSRPRGGSLLHTGSVRREPDHRRESAKTASPIKERATIRRRLPAARCGQQAATGRCAGSAER